MCGKAPKNGTDPHITVGLLDGVRLSIPPGASLDARIRAIAERQRGCISRAQLLAVGVKPAAIARRMRNGKLEPVHRCVYALPRTRGLRPARALLDVAPFLADRDVERLVDQGLFVLRILTLADIREVLARAGGHPGGRGSHEWPAAEPAPPRPTRRPRRRCSP